MARLQNRNKFIPNGFKFYDANLKWTAPANASFSVICDTLRNARLANPGVTKAKGLNTDPNAIADEVDRFNAAICEQHGWTDFYIGGSGGAAVPFPQAQVRPNPLQRLRNVVAGSETIVEWVASGAEAVPAELSAQRASVCAVCPLNKKGDWLSFFTAPAAAAIRAALQRKGEFKLSTPHDDALGVCGGCDCPIPLMVHVPIEQKLKHLNQAAHDALHSACWVLTEEAALKSK